MTNAIAEQDDGMGGSGTSAEASHVDGSKGRHEDARAAYEADVVARLKASGHPGKPHFARDGLDQYERPDIQAEFAAFRRGYNARQQLSESWQPIDTAPRDGTRFLGATLASTTLPGPEAKEIAPPWRFAVMWWDDQFAADGWDDEKGDLNYRGSWSANRVGSWAYEEYAEEAPTHWMPLPSPPLSEPNP